MTAAEYVRLEQPAAPAISPDGTRIAFTLRRPDTIAGRWNTQVSILDAATKRVWAATASAASCTAPAWSPDGTWLTFLSPREHLDLNLQKRAGTVQLFALPMTGGEAQAWSDVIGDVEEYAWSPDGRSIALLVEHPAGDKDPRIDWISSRDAKPGKDILLLDVASRMVRPLAQLDRGVAGLAWSPDASRIAYQTNYTGEFDDEQKYDVWTVDMKGTTAQLTRDPGPETRPRFSPDGLTVAFISQTVPDIEFAKEEISLVDSRGGAVRSLTREFPYGAGGFLWASDGRSIVFEANIGTTRSLYSVETANGRTTRIADAPLVFQDLSVARDGMLATTVESPTTLREIATVRNGAVTVLTDFSRQIAGYTRGEQEVMTVKSRDGKFDIEAVLVKPAGYAAGKRYPLALLYHGGPYGDFDNKWYQGYPVQLLAQRGVLCVLPNVRGSSGYTDAFGQANREDLGGGDYEDAVAVVDALIARGMADERRMAVLGGSYGGYLTNWTISQTRRFAAAVSMFGIFSWFTDWGNSWQPSFEKMYLGYDYWEKPIDGNSLWISRAPQTYVQNIVTPTLILQGTEDQYTNISNSREMYQALKGLGRDVEFVTYPGAGHGLRTKPNQWRNVLERTVDWVVRHTASK